jgi:predicted nucleic acid-binding protein
MAHTRRDQKYLALDSNVLIAYLDLEHPQHSKVASLAARKVALNPTVIHETYHTLVFKLKWKPEEAAGALLELLDDPAIMFLNQTKETTRAGVQLAKQYSLGGRDALILASFLNSAVPEMVTFDRTLIQIRKVEHGARSLRIRSA